MATLERRRGNFRVIFYLNSTRFTRALDTDNERSARASLARLEDNLRRVQEGRLVIPEGADVPIFLLSDGEVADKPVITKALTLESLFEQYFASLPEGALEATTIRGMEIHRRRLFLILGKDFAVKSLNLATLQEYVVTRSKDKGQRGRKLSAGTIHKEVVTLRTLWNWGIRAGLLSSRFPNAGLHFPKSHEKPPFQTFEQIEAKIKRGGLSDAEVDDLWDSLFLTLPEVEQCLAYAESNATQSFLYPMLVFAAHTGARRSEAIRCKFDDIDFESQTVQIHERKRVKGKYSTREAPLSPKLCSVLKDWFAVHPGGPFVFTLGKVAAAKCRKKRIDFEELTPSEATDHFNRTFAGHDKWSKLKGWHVFRHSFCSNCAAKGVDQRTINAWVGHQTEEMVKRYRHLLPSKSRQAIEMVFG